MDKEEYDVFDYEDYEEIYECHCGGQEWRYRVDGILICTSCHDMYNLEDFTPDC